MVTEKILGIWMQPSGVEIIEAEYDHDAHAYEISYISMEDALKALEEEEEEEYK